ncbi:MAG TPA: ribonuclease HI family protein [Terriglobales bacterium]|nr:ribonuclease HI family protein [Terriglobales bacterium]
MAKLFDDPSSEESRVECWFDGAIAPVNPGGHASYGVVIKVDGEVVLSEGGYVGHGPTMSNNVAEAAGAIRVLEALPTLLGALPDVATAVIYGDSQVVINQLPPRKKRQPQGLFVPYVRKAQALFEPLKPRVHFQWIPRERNAECDDLSKQVLIGRGIDFSDRSYEQLHRARLSHDLDNEFNEKYGEL